MQVTAEYILDREFSPEERAEIENDVLVGLDEQIENVRFVRSVKNRRYLCTRNVQGGKISVTIDVELSFLGKILGKI